MSAIFKIDVVESTNQYLCMKVFEWSHSDRVCDTYLTLPGWYEWSEGRGWCFGGNRDSPDFDIDRSEDAIFCLRWAKDNLDPPSLREFYKHLNPQGISEYQEYGVALARVMGWQSPAEGI